MIEGVGLPVTMVKLPEVHLIAALSNNTPILADVWLDNSNRRKSIEAL